MMVEVLVSFTRSTRKRSPGESVMPGFPFGPIRPNARAGLPLTVRVLVPAVRRSLAVRDSGAATVRVIGRKGIVPAMATPDARICRRVRSVDFPFSLNGVLPWRTRFGTCCAKWSRRPARPQPDGRNSGVLAHAGELQAEAASVHVGQPQSGVPTCCHVSSKFSYRAGPDLPKIAVNG